VPSGLVEWSEHEAAQVFAPLAHPIQHPQIVLVKGLFRPVIARFISTKPEHDQIDAALFELVLDMRFVVVQQAIGARPHQAKRVVHHARAIALDYDTVEAYSATSCVAKLDPMRSVRCCDRMDAVAERVGFGRDDLSLLFVEAHEELSAAGLLLVVDIEPGGVGAYTLLGGADPCPCAPFRSRLHAAVPVASVSILPAHDLAGIPGFRVRRLPNAVVLVRDVSFGGENEPMTRVPKTPLKVLSHGRRDQVGRNARVAIVPHTRDRAFLGPSRLFEGFVERAHAASRGVFDVDRNAGILRRVDLWLVFFLHGGCNDRLGSEVCRNGLAHRLSEALRAGFRAGRAAIRSSMAGEGGDLPPTLEETRDRQVFLSRNPRTQLFHRRNHIGQRTRGEHEDRHRGQVLQRRERVVNSFEHQNWK
jgi:hypothetical protein